MSDVKGKLKLGKYEFEVEENDWTKLSFSESYEEEYEDADEVPLTVSMEVRFQEGSFAASPEDEEETASPMFIINPFETGKYSIEDCIGMTFSVSNVEEADEREDSFYVFEHEPFMDYSFTIVDIKDGIAHITISGTAITDGYSRPVKTEKFSGEFWIETESY